MTLVDYPTSFAFPNTTFSYDTVGNRTQTVNGGTTQYITNTLNQYTSLSSHPTPLTYDRNGNLTHDGVRTYAYDAANRLTTILPPGTTGKPKKRAPLATYAYDWSNRLLEQTTAGTRTRVVYDGWEVLQEQTTGQPRRTFLNGPRIDEVLSQRDGSTTRFLLHDGLGSTVALTDPQGNLIERYAYDVFGSVQVLSPSGQPRATLPQTPSLFTGRWFHPETGLYDYRHRWYHPGIGRFLQTDPIGFAGGDVNLYSYVWNDPTSFLDSFGYSSDIYVPDLEKHGGPHVDRYTKQGQNPVGRYRKNGTPLEFKGKISPRIPNSDLTKFEKAAAKLPALLNLLALLPGLLEDCDRLLRAKQNGRTYREQLEEDLKNAGHVIDTPYGPLPNPYSAEGT